MDPIHPILPQPLNIPPVTEPPRVGRIDREERRERDQGRRDQTKSDDAGPDSGGPEHGDDPPAGHAHVDVTA